MDSRKGMTQTEQTHQHFDKAYGGDSAENYQRYFVPVIGGPVAKDLVRAANIGRGEKVLDVACGTGAATFLAKEKTGLEGTVAGVDLNPGMLGVARSMTPEGVSIDWHQSSAENMPLNDNTFDVAICSLSLQFFPDKPAALKEMHRVLAPGGRLAVIVPGPTPVFEAADTTFAHYLGNEAAGFVRTVFSLHDHDEIHHMIQDAGFRDVHVRSEKKSLHLPPPEDFLWQYMASTPLSAYIRKIDEDTYKKLEHEIIEQWQPFVRDSDLILEHDTIIATAVK